MLSAGEQNSVGVESRRGVGEGSTYRYLPACENDSCRTARIALTVAKKGILMFELQHSFYADYRRKEH